MNKNAKNIPDIIDWRRIMKF